MKYKIYRPNSKVDDSSIMHVRLTEDGVKPSRLTSFPASGEESKYVNHDDLEFNEKLAEKLAERKRM